MQSRAWGLEAGPDREGLEHLSQAVNDPARESRNENRLPHFFTSRSVVFTKNRSQMVSVRQVHLSHGNHSPLRRIPDWCQTLCLVTGGCNPSW